MSKPEPIASAIPTARYWEGCDMLDDALDEADGVADMVVVGGRARPCLWKMTLAVTILLQKGAAYFWILSCRGR